MCTTGHARNPIEKWTRTAGLRTVYSGMKDGIKMSKNEVTSSTALEKACLSLLDSYPFLS
jgi:hypothetical protein